MKQTAVDWLVEQLINNKELISLDFNQAKEKEKEQIMDAYEIGFADGWDYARYNDEPRHEDAENYYNETFKSE